MGRTDRSRRLIAVTPAALYRALLEQEALERWLPPDGMSGRVERFDPRPGGGFRMELTYLDRADNPGKASASQDVTEVEIAALEPDDRVVWRIDFASGDPAYADTMTMTWTLTEVEGGTEVSVRPTTCRRASRCPTTRPGSLVARQPRCVYRAPW